MNYQIESNIKSVALEDPLLNLIELVSINSQTKNYKGVETAQYYVAKKLERLGFQTQMIKNTEVSSGPMLIAEKKGQVDNWFTLIGHTDTVNNPDRYPLSIDSKNDRVYGAGVADDKGGVVIGISSLEKFLIRNPRHNCSLRFMISPNEELGSTGFHSLLNQIGQKSHFLFGLEPADPRGRIIHSRNGNRWYKIKIQGRSAHSGRFGEEYINAAHQLFRIGYEMMLLNNEQEKMRVNFGAIKTSESSYNTISANAEAKIDTRFNTILQRDKIHHSLESLLSESLEQCPYSQKLAQVFYSIEDDCPPLTLKNSNLELASIICNFIEHIEERKTESIHSGGAADINYLSSPANSGVDGLGPIGGNLHTNKEYIETSSLISRAEVLYNTLNYLEFLSKE